MKMFLLWVQEKERSELRKEIPSERSCPAHSQNAGVQPEEEPGHPGATADDHAGHFHRSTLLPGICCSKSFLRPTPPFGTTNFLKLHSHHQSFPTHLPAMINFGNHYVIWMWQKHRSLITKCLELCFGSYLNLLAPLILCPIELGHTVYVCLWTANCSCLHCDVLLIKHF